MKWQKTSDYSITTGRFHIAKALVMGEPKFTLWDNHTIVGTWGTAQEAKNHVNRLEVEREAIAGSSGTAGQDLSKG